jgi:hypothetical protein
VSGNSCRAGSGLASQAFSIQKVSPLVGITDLSNVLQLTDISRPTRLLIRIVRRTPTGTPTGTIANGNQTDFLPAPGEPAVFLFSTIDGPIAGWNHNVAVAQGTAPPSTQVTLASAQPLSLNR